MKKVIASVTRAIEERSETTYQKYLEMIKKQVNMGRFREHLSCANIAHAAASSTDEVKEHLIIGDAKNFAIVSAYNDMVSAHTPYETYTGLIKDTLLRFGMSAQVAGMVPAMCDGVTQGQPGMDLSLFSRDVIAKSVAIALSHNIFDGVFLLGVCDKIAPGMLMGAAAFAHLPCAVVPTGPMESGISNKEKALVREKYVRGEIDKIELQRMECQCYHSKGCCTFYGTANTNMLICESLGLMLPGQAFIMAESELRDALTFFETCALAGQIAGISPKPLYKVLTPKNLVNALVVLLASGGSTNHTLHLVAMARSLGIIITWDDIATLSHAVPLLLRIYPNGVCDVNDFERVGGVPALLTALKNRGLVHEDVEGVFGGFDLMQKKALVINDRLIFDDPKDTRDDIFAPPNSNKDEPILITKGKPFAKEGGLKVLHGNLGESIIKVSAVAQEHLYVKAPCRVFNSQYEVAAAYKNGEFKEDVIIVVRFCGPAACGMPELHMLMPVLNNLLKSGLKVALVTDGRLSGASGGVPCALHLYPEAKVGGAIAKLMDGDEIEFDAVNGTLNTSADLSNRKALEIELDNDTFGRYLFEDSRNHVGASGEGATTLF